MYKTRVCAKHQNTGMHRASTRVCAKHQNYNKSLKEMHSKYGRYKKGVTPNLKGFRQIVTKLPEWVAIYTK